MQRVRVKELLAQYNEGRSNKVEQKELALHIFRDEDVTAKTKELMLSGINKGVENRLSRMKPKHYLRLASYFGITDITALVESDEV